MPVKLEEKELKTCLITIVNNGLPDSVIKVYPARHEKEKIWRGTSQGEARWAIVERLIENFAERGRAIPKPAPLHSDYKQSLMPDLKPDQYPEVKLENGAILGEPPEEEKFNPEIMQAPSVNQVSNEVKQLKADVASIAQGLSSLTSAIQGLARPQAKRGRPKKEKTV